MIQASRLRMMDLIYPQKDVAIMFFCFFCLLLLLFYWPQPWIGMFQVITRMQRTFPNFPAPRHCPRVQETKGESLTKNEI